MSWLISIELDSLSCEESEVIENYKMKNSYTQLGSIPKASAFD